ncbi:DMT family transporter [Acuticoccus mangrovi]|uniref:EamA family transporter n=1 Tax=Acuticoccus mangrovi TaxID=2796142 RepID=A0A934II99_9HYPH|nr:EamA family transporter [Acuticoccus mangrovi]MBJ3777229.1 EamA family transporter [Acuticoccus mangrovi]
MDRPPLSRAAPLRAIALLAVLAAAMLWGTIGTLQALMPPGRDPLIVASLRLTLGAATLGALALLAPPARRALLRLPRGGILLAGAAMGIYNMIFFVAVGLAGVGIATALAIGSAPVWVSLYEHTRYGVRPTRARLAGQAASIAGAVLLAAAGRALDASLTGILMALGAGSLYATYSLATSRLATRAPSGAVAAATFAVAAVVVAPVWLVADAAWITAPGAWPKLLALGIVSTGLAYALYTFGLTVVAASTAVTLSLAEPLTAWLLATVVVGEPLTLTKAVGAILVFAGLAVTTLTSARGGTQSDPPN